MSETVVADPRYKVQRRCAACEGEGVVWASSCPKCGEPLPTDGEWWQHELLPCGHEPFMAQVDCQVCAGTGSVEHILTEEEYQQLRRKRITRGIFLLILALIPLILLLIAIISREPDLIFGGWWY